MKIEINNCDFNDGFYHFTNYQNLKSIFERGLIPYIGTASKIVNDRPNVSISKGAKGIMGIVNSFIFMFKNMKICEIPEEYKKYFIEIKNFDSDEIIGEKITCNAIKRKLSEEVYLHIEMNDEQLSRARIGGLTGFDINLDNKIDKSQISVIIDSNGNIMSAYDICNYIYQKVKDIEVFRDFNEDFFTMMELSNQEIKEEKTSFNTK